MEELEQELTLDERIANLQAVIDVATYELELLLKEKKYVPVGFKYLKEKNVRKTK